MSSELGEKCSVCVLTFVMTVCPSCAFTKSFTELEGAASKRLPPIKCEGRLNLAEYEGAIETFLEWLGRAFPFALTPLTSLEPISARVSDVEECGTGRVQLLLRCGLPMQLPKPFDADYPGANSLVLSARKTPTNTYKEACSRNNCS